MNEGTLGDLSEDQTSALDVMLRAETRLEELIEKMIQFSLEATGQFTLKMKVVDFCEVVGNALKQPRLKATGRPVALSVVIPSDCCRVSMDQEKIQWVVTELVDNAIKFTLPGGKVTVTLEKDAGFAQFKVADTGIGISAEQLSEIFEPYHQLDGSSTRRYGGVGLGLALVKKIIEAHGSRVDINSEAGKGTLIKFKLPVIEAE
jgi:signal transduction histidine kinase